MSERNLWPDDIRETLGADGELDGDAAFGETRRMRVVVTGAAGTVGGEVARLLAPNHDVRSLTRDPARAARQGVAGHIVGADLGDPATLRHAMEGADALLLVTFDPLNPTHDANALAAARAGGVRHVVKLSAAAVCDPLAQDRITCWQRESEERVRASGLTWTLLRPRAFMSNALGWAAGVRKEGVVRALYGTSRNSCVDPQDVARAAVRSLVVRGQAGRIHALTGQQALSVREQADQLGESLQQPVCYEELTPDQALRGWRDRLGEPLARALLASAERQAAGAKEQVTDGVREATGRPPGTFRAWASRHAAAFR
ncbi:NAD(P)H-binding protein [Streptomyces sp. WM6378]|uniref:NAD(P)H-binding protein n=1 Tax=Streptomyces sp. WM6378 TaxID=1415557 RepID=UPI000AA43C48|nr:NAD(P)H-binding protein [Streptomyces sp. WM6378]